MRLLAGHLVLWTSVLIAVRLPTHSALALGTIALSTQIVVMSVGLAIAVLVAARSGARALVGAALVLAVPAVRTLVMYALEATAGTLGYYRVRAIIMALIATGVTLATAGWLVARRRHLECLWALPVAALLSLVTYLLVDSHSLAVSLGWSRVLNSLGWTVYMVPAVVSAWAAVVLDRRFGRRAG